MSTIEYSLGFQNMVWNKLLQIVYVMAILVTASAMPTALRIKPMPNADGIGQTALDGIEIDFFGEF